MEYILAVFAGLYTILLLTLNTLFGEEITDVDRSANLWFLTRGKQ